MNQRERIQLGAELYAGTASGNMSRRAAEYLEARAAEITPEEILARAQAAHELGEQAMVEFLSGQ